MTSTKRFQKLAVKQWNTCLLQLPGWKTPALQNGKQEHCDSCLQTFAYKKESSNIHPTPSRSCHVESQRFPRRKNLSLVQFLLILLPAIARIVSPNEWEIPSCWKKFPKVFESSVLYGLRCAKTIWLMWHDGQPWASKEFQLSQPLMRFSSSRKSLLLSQTKFSELWMAALCYQQLRFRNTYYVIQFDLRRVHRLRREMRWHVRFDISRPRDIFFPKNFNLMALDAKCGCGDSKVHYVTCAGIICYFAVIDLWWFM